jgi:hypothetical protein
MASERDRLRSAKTASVDHTEARKPTDVSSVQNGLRPVAMGRKNGRNPTSDRGGRTGTVFYSLAGPAGTTTSIPSRPSETPSGASRLDSPIRSMNGGPTSGSPRILPRGPRPQPERRRGEAGISAHRRSAQSVPAYPQMTRGHIQELPPPRHGWHDPIRARATPLRRRS